VSHIAVVIVNSLTLMHCQGLGLGYMFVADFRYRLIRRALIFARFSAIGMGPAYTWEGLYVSIYGS